MSPWPRTVPVEAQAVGMRIEADERLAAAAGGAARYFAELAGLASGEVAALQSATVAACGQAFHRLTSEHPWLQVTFTWFADRIEVALRYEGEPEPVVGLDTLAGFAAARGSRSPASVLGGVDRVQFDTEGESGVTRLTKYIGPPAPASS